MLHYSYDKESLIASQRTILNLSASLLMWNVVQTDLLSSVITLVLNYCLKDELIAGALMVNIIEKKN
jgi:hypothetical protein